MSTFTWLPDYSANKTVEPNVSVIKFGDGYEGRQTYGLNSKPQKWSLQFQNRTQTEANEIDDFLNARGAVESFDWTPPDSDTAYKFVCRSWSKPIEHAGIWSIAAEFVQVFEP